MLSLYLLECTSSLLRTTSFSKLCLGQEKQTPGIPDAMLSPSLLILSSTIMTPNGGLAFFY
jgi:hypothetical protein